MSSNQATTHPGRKRRAHKRSRNGCLTCKKRHIRCNELKPVCTNCLTRGGECGYAEAVTRPARGSTPASSFITTTTRHGQQQAEQQSRLRLSGPLVSSPADPFDSLLMEMPLRSLELFHQFVNYRIFSRAKNPNSQCAGIALSNPGTFRACLIMTALHRSWLSNTTNGVATNYTDMEETYLYHKLEAMRLVNEQIADPNLCTSDGCLSLIAGLALAESGMGDCVAAEAHLNGLFILIDMKRPEEWQHRFYGMLQRIILMAGSFIAASKTPATLPSDNSDYDCPLLPDYTKPPSPLFSTALFATRLSPFYRFSTPCMEACKADVEGEVLINALRRLTSICFSSSSSLHCSSPSPSSSNTTNNPPPATAPADARITSILLSDTEAYIASLLFKPDPFDTSALSPSSPASDPLRLSSSSRKKKKTCSRIREQPYQTLPAEFFPCSSRAWATAAYLYLHVVLVQLWEGQHPQTSSPPATTEMETAKKKPHKIDPHLLRFLLDTLKEDAMATEEAMRVGAYSSELWIWKALLGAYVTHITEQDGVYTQPIPRDCGEKIGKNSSSSTPRTSLARSESCGSVGSEDSDHFFSFFGGFGDDNDNENDDSEENEDADDDDEDEEEKAQDERRMQRSKSVEETNYLDSMRSWFRSKLTTWSRVSKVTEWSVVRQMLGRIVWVSEDNVSDGESVMEGLWWDVVHRPPHEFEGDYMRAEILRRGSPLVAVTLPVDPALK